MRGKRDSSVRQIGVKVITSASRPRVEQVDDGSLRVYVKSAPERGKANDELRCMLAEFFGVSRSRVRITGGKHSRRKTVVLDR